MEMPGMTGIELLKILPRQTLPSLPLPKRIMPLKVFDLNAGGGLAYRTYYA
jgi:hypothetical protein